MTWGPSRWLHERLVHQSRGRRLDGLRATAVDHLVSAGAGNYLRTRASLLILQGRHGEALAQLRSLADLGDQHAEQDLAALLREPPCLREIRIGDHPDPVHLCGLQFSRDGTALTAWGHGEKVSAQVVLWDVATATPRGVQRLSTPHPAGVSIGDDFTVTERFSGAPQRYPERLAGPRGAVVAVRTRGRVRLRHARTGDMIHDLAVPGTTAMAFSPDGTLLAVGTVTEGVRLFDLATGRPVRTIATAASAIAFRRDGSVMATADAEGGTIRLWILMDRPAGGP